MSKFFVLLKKEIRELLTPQTLIPLLITIVMFVAIGKFVGNETKKTDNKTRITVADIDKTNVSNSVVELIKQTGAQVTISDKTDDIEIVKEAGASKQTAVIIIPKDFGSNLLALKQPELKGYTIVNGFSMMGTQKIVQLSATLTALNDLISSQIISQMGPYDPAIVKSPVKMTDFVSVHNRLSQVSPTQVITYVSTQSQFIPIILFMVIIFAAQMIATAIATEKENKTLEILVSAPVSRQAIVAAKMIGAAIIALLTSAVYMFSFRYYIDQMSGGALGAAGSSDAIKENLHQLGLVFSNGDYVLLGLSLFMGILCALAIAFILGAFAEDVKGIQSTITPLMVAVLLPYLISMFLDVNSFSQVAKWAYYAIPFSHPFLAPQALYFDNYALVAGGIIYQAIVFVIFVYIASRVFSSEKLMTLKFSFGKKKK